MQEDGVNITPNEYKLYFCKEAKKHGLSIDDCSELERYTSRMGEILQKQFKQYYAKSLDDLFVFLTSNLNRANLGDAELLNNILFAFLNTVMETVTKLGDKDAKELALDTEHKLKDFRDQKWLDFMRNRFVGYNKNFASPIDERWSTHIFGIKEDIGGFSSRAYEVLEKQLIFKEHVPDVANPSLSKDQHVKFELVSALEKATDKEGIEKAIKEAFSQRVQLDKKAIDNHTKALNEVIDLLSQKLISMIDKNEVFKQSIYDIKEALEEVTERDSIETAKSKMVSIAEKLSGEIGQLSHSLDEKNREINVLRKKIKELEGSLSVAEEKSKTDYLTKTLTKRAFDEELGRFESLYERHDSIYALLFLDIDHFKSINDTYGHDAGDKVLSNIGALLNQHTRPEDVVGRFGGEEFIVVLPNTSYEGAVSFAEHIRNLVEHTKFMYKGKRIPVTMSIGIGMRDRSSGLDHTLKTADDNLYHAKKRGRNRVEG